MLKLCEVHARYGDSHILQGVDLEVPPGSVAALFGRNGVGKTTTVHTVIGFNPPTSGEIWFKGTDISGWEAHRIVRRGIALVPQGRRIFPSLSVRENLTLGWRKDSPLTMADDLDKMYGLFPVLATKAKQRGCHLSGGEQQMLAIARALMTNPQLILMDEPLEGLAPLVVKELCQKISELKDRGLSVLLVEQNINAALTVADYVYIMSRGMIVYQGTPAEFESAEDIKRRFLVL